MSSLSGWPLHVGHSYKQPMMVIFVFLLVGASAAIVPMRSKWRRR
ncbi:hypothetical protein [Burkholderia plantarii]|nr:hypothetical protein [Burkholderia plantarii]